jgi:amino acid adenylation domain-containing protein/FkbM family methyltransferase
MRRRLALGSSPATLSQRARLAPACGPSELEGAVRACIARFDALRLRPVQVDGVPVPFADTSGEARVTVVRCPPGAAVEAPRSSAGDAGVEVEIAPDGDAAWLTLRVPAHCADRRSLEIVLERIAGAAGGTGAQPTAPEVAYREVAQWLHELSVSSEGARGKLYWRRSVPAEALAGGVGADDGTPVEAQCRRALGGLTETFAEREALAAAAWLHVVRWTAGNPALAVGCLADGRLEEGLADAVGPLSRYVPLAVREPRGSARAAVLAVREALAEGRQWQELFHFDDLRDERPGPDYFPYCFEYTRAADHAQARLVLAEAAGDIDRYELLLRCEERDGELRAILRSRRPGVQPAELDTLLERWLNLFARSREHPDSGFGEPSLLTRRERAAWPWRGPTVAVDGTLHEALGRACRAYADRVAVSAGGRELTFEKLGALAEGLASLLAPLPAEAIVGVHADRTAEAIIAIFAILKLGGAFLPLHPSLPEARRRRLLEDAGAQLVLSARPWREGGGSCDVLDLRAAIEAARGPVARRCAPAVHADQLAYVLFTSGSTGVPLGAAVSHRAVLNLWHGLNGTLAELDRPRRVGMNGPLAFDTSIKQLVQLLSGHTLVLVPEERRLDPPAFWAHAEAQQIEVLDVTPSHLTRLMAGDASLHVLPRVVLLGGEPVPAALRARLHFERAYDLYGLTECAVDSIVGALDEPPATSPGPLCNTQVMLLDARRRPAPEGVSAELSLGGLGLARGYMHSPARTAERFVPSALGDGTRTFLTGDHAVYTAAEGLRHRGRSGSLVKIRGQRVALREVQACLLEHPSLAAAVVAKRELPDGAERLVAWVVPHEKHAPVVDGFTRWAHGPLSVAGVNRHETAFLYGEVFERRAYLRHGLTVGDGACVFDVGANIGLFSLQAHLLARDVTLFAFEPNPEVHRCLLANARVFGLSGRFLPLALGRRRGTAEFTEYAGFSILSGFHGDRQADLAVVREYVQQQSPGAPPLLDDGLMAELLVERFEERRLSLPVTTLSDVIREHRVQRIDLLKINVEKSEADVLAGIEDAHWPLVAQVALEVHDVDGRLDAVVELLRARGFAVATEKDWSLPGRASINHYVYAARGALRAGARDEPLPPVEGLPTPLKSGEVRAFVAARLPEAHVPSRVIVVERLPLNDNGKVDQAALDARLSEPDADQAVEPPRTPLEQQLLQAWQEILQREGLSVEANFLDSGGDSFAIMQLNARLRRLVGFDVPVVDMFRHASVRALARHVTELGAPAGAPASRGSGHGAG